MTVPGPVASLPMYDHPAARWATDALWAALAAALRERGVAAPGRLDRRPAYAEVWTEPALLLSQTCGYPYATRLRGRVRLVATPAYRAPGCEGARYRSLLMVRAEDPARSLADLRGRVAAFNATDSQSGWNALRAAVAPLARGGRFFARAVATGSHGASLAAVARGEADLCAVDGVAWALAARHEAGATARFRCVGATAAAPGLPLVTSGGADDATLAALRDALRSALAEPALAGARDALLIEGFEIPADDAYDAILAMERRAVAAGYPRLDGVEVGA